MSLQTGARNTAQQIVVIALLETKRVIVVRHSMLAPVCATLILLNDSDCH